VSFAARAFDPIRLAIGTFTVLRVGPPSRVDRRTAGAAMVLAPAVGAVLGGLACLVGLGLERVWAAPWLVAAAVVAVLAAMTRGLHLDGLADVADALGSGRDAEGALAVMRRGDVGPFGVATLVLTLLLQTGAVAVLVADGRLWSLVVATATGRLAATVGCLRPVPAARPDGLGAAVAGSVPPVAFAAVAAVVIAVSAAAGWRGPVGVLVGLGAAAVLLVRCVRRFDGITGDVLGALVEVATTGALLVLAT